MRYLLLRNTVAGRDRDWAVAIRGNSILVRFGSTGSRLQLREPDKGSWRETTPQAEARRRLNAQQREGYWVVGSAEILSDGTIESIDENRAAGLPEHDDTAPTGQRSRKAALFWTVDAPSWAALKAALDDVAAAFTAAELEVGWVSRPKLPTGVPVVAGTPLTFSGHEGSGPVRWAGELVPGLDASVLLFVLTLRLRAPGNGIEVKAADADGRDIGLVKHHPDLLAAFGTTFEQIRPLTAAITTGPAARPVASAPARRFRRA